MKKLIAGLLVFMCCGICWAQEYEKAIQEIDRRLEVLQMEANYLVQLKSAYQEIMKLEAKKDVTEKVVPPEAD